jgi:hypothetical protein
VPVLQASAVADRFGDPFLADSEPDDVRALLERHIDAASLDPSALAARLAAAAPPGPAPAPAETPAARRVTLHVDALLAGKGLLDWQRAVLHPIRLLLVVGLDPLDPGDAPPAAGAAPLLASARRARRAASAAGLALRRLQAAQLALRARLHGAAAAATGGAPGLTHVVGVVGGVGDGDPDAAAATPAALLQGVAGQAGGAQGVLGLERALGRRPEERPHLVAGGWLLECFAAAAAAAGRAPPAAEVELPDEQGGLRRRPRAMRVHRARGRSACGGSA